MIFDGPDKFPNSTVEYVRFKFFSLRERFAKLREQEFWLQDTLAKAAIKEEKWPEVWNALVRSPYYPLIRQKLFLEFTEGELMWMAHNVADEEVDDKRPKLPKQKKVKVVKKSRQISLFEEQVC